MDRLPKARQAVPRRGGLRVAEADQELWAVWRRLVAALPWWRMPFELFFSASIWRMFGVDLLSGLLKNRTTAKVFALLEPLSVRDLRRVHAVAALNHRRHEAVSRWTAIALVTLPASAALTLSELSPTTLRAIAGAEGPTSWYLVLGYLAAAVGLYLIWAWRARQLLTVIEMHLIQRGVGLGEAAATEDPPLEPPIGG